ncbi:hypothetical protein Rruber_05411 (plasmid) [Rhodococcus ruber]
MAGRDRKSPRLRDQAHLWITVVTRGGAPRRRADNTRGRPPRATDARRRRGRTEAARCRRRCTRGGRLLHRTATNSDCWTAFEHGGAECPMGTPHVPGGLVNRKRRNRPWIGVGDGRCADRHGPRASRGARAGKRPRREGRKAHCSGGVSVLDRAGDSDARPSGVWGRPRQARRQALDETLPCGVTPPAPSGLGGSVVPEIAPRQSVSERPCHALHRALGEPPGRAPERALSIAVSPRYRRCAQSPPRHDA